PHSRTIAFGDAENDIQMLAWANIGVGMLNGNEYCKAHADIITVDDNNHDGIIKTLPLILDKIK
ncbi:MAG: HAD hydrolase family protein, partial [Bacilli bacterium]